MGYALVRVMAIGVLLGGCQQLDVREGVLSTNQRVAMVSSPGDGVSPPTNVVLYEAVPGQFVPVSTGFAQAPTTAFLAGAGSGVAIGLGNYYAAKSLRPSTTNVDSSADAKSESIGEQNVEQLVEEQTNINQEITQNSDIEQTNVCNTCTSQSNSAEVDQAAANVVAN